ncbi:MAG: DNA/RNA nuclease SfsA [Bacteriovoracaceae bacterium]|nr:DNA/RNA nuclease SfsA [Bacteriovoracaceae bacterium]
MIFQTTLIEGTIQKRYKRFLVDVKLKNGELITAHIANTGSMKSCWAPGWKTLLSYHDNPKRKLKYSVELIHNGKSWIGVNTSRTNQLAIDGIKNGIISELSGYKFIKPEVKIGDNSRLDILLYNNDEDRCFVEVKNVTLKVGDNIASFPDAVTTRGQKHLLELEKIVKNKDRACMLYIIQREDISCFTPAIEIDPEYVLLLQKAHLAGVEILVYQCSITPSEIKVAKKIISAI